MALRVLSGSVVKGKLGGGTRVVVMTGMGTLGGTVTHSLVSVSKWRLDRKDSSVLGQHGPLPRQPMMEIPIIPGVKG